MRILPLALITAIALLSQRGWADEAPGGKVPETPAEESPYSIYLHAQVPTEAQRAKILSVIGVPPNWSPLRIRFEIQNSLADAKVVGFIATVSYKNTDTGKDMSFDVFGGCEVAPLSPYAGELLLFDSEKTASFNPKVEIKEFRIKKLPDTK